MDGRVALDGRDRVVERQASNMLCKSRSSAALNGGVFFFSLYLFCCFCLISFSIFCHLVALNHIMFDAQKLIKFKDDKVLTEESTQGPGHLIPHVCYFERLE